MQKHATAVFTDLGSQNVSWAVTLEVGVSLLVLCVLYKH